MYEAVLAALVLTNIVTLVLYVRSVDREGTSGARYNIVGFWDGKVLQGPLSLQKARRAQKKWDSLFVWHDGPRTSIEVARARARKE